ncbi:hypothetical protein HanHA300_Chr08g0298231 [Helianthus annuus]|nr:hypothetical protein HanHA300_Chr08g0298231 [Helianthus annuus]KAJ0555196.1 hypothetical protein HanHA89_Chr08g0316871 [Helianthus annuus]
MRQGFIHIILHGIKPLALILFFFPPLLPSPSYCYFFSSFFFLFLQPIPFLHPLSQPINPSSPFIIVSSNSIHPAVTVSNIKNFIPIILDMKTDHYNTWSEFFKIHCKAYDVIDHLKPRQQPATSSTDKEKEATSPKPLESWDRLDAIVLQWIYGTISQDLVFTIMKNNSTAYAAWCTLENLFQDNQASRTIDLQNKFANTRLDQFPNMSDYCQAMKLIFDQLTNLGSNITEKQLVLQILTGLNDQYESISLIIQQTDPLPDFFNTRSRLCQVEDRKATQAKLAAQQAGTALSATIDQTRSTTDNRFTNRTESDRSRGRGRGRGRGRSSFGRGRPRNTYPTQFGPNSYWTFPP